MAYIKLQKVAGLFPSPIGELHFSICFRRSWIEFMRLEFPSPIGELHFSIVIVGSIIAAQACFRPLSGSYISQFLYQYELPQLSGFPSPIGELHFSIKKAGIIRNDISVSVPYRGATFLNGDSRMYQRTAQSFRPLSGSYISQSGQRYQCVSKKSFRPLSGSYISQLNIKLLRH